MGRAVDTVFGKTVGKMINIMGTPINDTDKQIMIDYLAQNYGK